MYAVHGFVGGLMSPWQALRFVRQHPVLWSYILWPFVIAFLVLTLGEALSIWAVWSWIGNLFAGVSIWYWEVLQWLGAVLLGLALLAGGVVIFTSLAAVRCRGQLCGGRVRSPRLQGKPLARK